jgi:hypothetical protein
VLADESAKREGLSPASMRIVLAKGSSGYGALRLHIDQLAAAIQALGHETTVIDLTGAENGLSTALASSADGFLSFNGVGHDLAAQDVFRRAGCAFVSLYVDHPVHHLARLDDGIANQLLFFLDRSHVAFMAAWGANRRFAHIGFSPPGANELAEPADLSDEAFERRDIPLLFTGTYRGAPDPSWRDWPDSAAKSLVGETTERMAADGELALLDALDAALAVRGSERSPDLLEAIAPLLATAQHYAEAYHRHAALTAFGAAGIPIEVHGLGWEPLCSRYPSIRHAGIGRFEDSLRLLRRARLVLNINNGFVAGGHERVFAAMAAGAAVFSETSRYYADAFEQGVEMASYSPSRLAAAAADRLLALLADVPAQAAMARAGCRRVLAEHRWTVRAALVIAALEDAQQNRRPSP